MFVMALDGILNDIQETNERTEEERKRDHRNALRRAAYRRNKDKRIHDQNNNASATSGMCVCLITVSMAVPATLYVTPPNTINQNFLFTY